MAGQYLVTAACVVAKTSSETGEGYFYRDAVLPAGVPVAEKERLVAAGLVTVVEVEVVEAVDTETETETETTPPPPAKPAAAPTPVQKTGTK